MTPPPSIDLNADLGEGGSHDTALIQMVSSANIACGGHAGDSATMAATLESALAHGVAIGAHPGYEDPAHFGRRPLELQSAEVRDMICRQLERLLAIHPNLHHVKPHGALYHQANSNPAIADAVLEAIASLAPFAILYSPPSGELADSAKLHGIRHCGEGFIDRRYQPDGSLCPRTHPDAMIHIPEEAMRQAIDIAMHQRVVTSDATRIPLQAHTLCVHGDSPDAIAIMAQTRQALMKAGIKISAP